MFSRFKNPTVPTAVTGIEAVQSLLDRAQKIVGDDCDLSVSIEISKGEITCHVSFKKAGLRRSVMKRFSVNQWLIQNDRELMLDVFLLSIQRLNHSLS